MKSPPGGAEKPLSLVVMHNQIDEEMEGWLTPEQAAELLGVHPKTLGRWADAGRLETFRTIGGHRRFRKGQILALQGVHLKSKADPGAAESPRH